MPPQRPRAGGAQQGPRAAAHTYRPPAKEVHSAETTAAASRARPGDPGAGIGGRAGTRMKAGAGMESILGWGRVTTITCSPGRSSLRISAFRGLRPGGVRGAGAPRRRPSPHARGPTESTTRREPESSSRDACPVISLSPGRCARTCLPSVISTAFDPLVERGAAGQSGGGVAVGVAETAVQQVQNGTGSSSGGRCGPPSPAVQAAPRWRWGPAVRLVE